MRIAIAIIFLTIFILSGAEETKKTPINNIKLEVLDVTTLPAKNQMVIKYVVKNSSDQDTWVCISDNMEKIIGDKLVTGVVKIVDEQNKYVILEVKSIHLDVLTEFLGALYRKIEKNKSQEFNLVVDFPIKDKSDLFYHVLSESDENYAKNYAKKHGLEIKTDKLELKDMIELTLRVGYYKLNLGEIFSNQKVHPDNTKKVDYRWAMENKEEVVEAKISLKNSESTSGVKP